MRLKIGFHLKKKCIQWRKHSSNADDKAGKQSINITSAFPKLRELPTRENIFVGKLRQNGNRWRLSYLFKSYLALWLCFYWFETGSTYK